MSGPLSRAPEGLLDLVGVKGVSQRYPANLGDSIAPVVDVTGLLQSFYAVYALATNPGVINASAGATVSDIASASWLSFGFVDLAEGAAVTRVPAGELWIVDEALVQWALPANAGSSASFGLVCASPNAGFFQMADQLGGFTDSAAAAARNGWRQSTRPSIMMPGDRMRLTSDGIVLTAGSLVWQASVRVRRLLR